MNRILAIAGLTLRSAMRSRVFALLAVLLAAGILGLPLIMKSDGTLAGQVQLFLRYTLGLTVALLSIMAVWTGAGAVSLEVAGREIHLVVVKPVRALEVWLGKWLGLMGINLVLLTLSGAMIYGQLCWTTRSSLLSAADQARLRDDILVARRNVPPAQSDNRGNSLPIAPGKTGQWQFILPPRARADEPARLQFRFVTSRPDYRAPVAGEWLIGDARGSGRDRYPMSAVANRMYTLKIPVPADCRRLAVAYVNIEEKTPVTVLFDADDSVMVGVNESRFESNYLRALLITLARLSFFSALGLTAGVVFSFPVAVFVSLALLLVSAVNRWMQQIIAVGFPGDGDGASGGALTILIDRLIQYMFIALDAIMPPLYRLDPLDYLPEGLFMAWSLVGKAWLALGVIYPGILALAGAWLFSRRELGLPTN